MPSTKLLLLSDLIIIIRIDDVTLDHSVGYGDDPLGLLGNTGVVCDDDDCPSLVVKPFYYGDYIDNSKKINIRPL